MIDRKQLDYHLQIIQNVQKNDTFKSISEYKHGWAKGYEHAIIDLLLILDKLEQEKED